MHAEEGGHSWRRVHPAAGRCADEGARVASWLAAAAGALALAACSGEKSRRLHRARTSPRSESALTTVVVTVTNTSGAAQAGVLVYAAEEVDRRLRPDADHERRGGRIVLARQRPVPLRDARQPSDYYFFSGAPGSCPMPSCTSAAITVTTPVQVTVVDTDGAPQADAHVLAEDPQGNFENDNYTGANGQAPVSVPPGTYKFAVPGSGQGFLFHGPNCTVPGCTATTVTITHPVTITVVNSAGVPLPDYEVLAEDPNGEYWNIDYTNAQGQVQLSVDPGAYRFVVPDGPVLFPSGAHGSCVVPGCTTATIVIPDPVVLSVVNGAGQPVAGQLVKARREGSSEHVAMTTDAAGQATFTLPAGNWRFEAICGAEVFYSGNAGSCASPAARPRASPPICGACAGKPNGSACNDATPARRPTPASRGACVGAIRSRAARRTSATTPGRATSQTGACTNPAKANGTACNDGNACTRPTRASRGAVRRGRTRARRSSSPRRPPITPRARR